MIDASVLSILEDIGAILLDTHVVYTSGRHGSSYVNLDVLYTHTTETSLICAHLAEQFADAEVDVVAGSTVTGVILSQWVAHHLGAQTGRPVLSVYAEEEGFIGQRTFRRGYNELLYGRRVLTVEGILTTGGSARKLLKAVRGAGGTLVGMGVICNRGGIAAGHLGIPRLHALVDVFMEAWDELSCPLCQAGVAVNPRVGKGAAFVARNRARLKQHNA